MEIKSMSKTTYPGINYAGIGSTTNMDAETGIRYGVISQNSVHPESVDDIYFGPHSRDLAWEAGVEEAKQQIMRCYEEDLYEDKKGELKKVLKNYVSGRFIEDRLSELMDLFSEMVSDPPGGKPNLPDVEHVWAVVEQDFNDNAGEHECNPLYEHDGYKITKCLDNDLMILKSPFFTYAQFCSPCVPGACNLDSPLDADLSDSGPYSTKEDTHTANELSISAEDLRRDRAKEDMASNKCYCLGGEWFDDDQPSPYPIYSVETGKLVQPA